MTTKPDDCEAMVLDACCRDCVYRRAVEQRLEAASYLALRRIHCECRDGALSLRGSVPSYYVKQVAQAIAAEAASACRIDNQLCVLPAQARTT